MNTISYRLTEIKSITFITAFITNSYSVKEMHFFLTRLELLALIFLHLKSHKSKIYIHNSFLRDFFHAVTKQVQLVHPYRTNLEGGEALNHFHKNLYFLILNFFAFLVQNLTITFCLS